MRNQENQEQESYWDRLKAFKDQERSLDRLKAFKDKKIPFTDKGKATVAAVPGALMLFESLHSLPGNAGAAVSIVAFGLTALHGEKAFQVGRWLRGKFIEDNVLPEQNDGSALDERGTGESEEVLDNDLDDSTQTRQSNFNVRPPSLKRLVGTQSSGDIDLAPGLQLGINDIAGKATFICGIRRSGKTTLGVRIAEEMGKFNMPMLIPDLKGDWLSCVDTLPNAVILRQGEATEKNAVSHGYAICEEGLQIILDVASYDDMNEVAVVIAGMIAGVFHWEKKHLDSRRLCAIFLDEAQSYLPQDVKDSIISDPVARDAMMNAYMQVLAVGGSLGLFPVILTQRISQVAKKIVAQSELAFLLKQTMDLDINRYQSFTTVQKEKIRALKQGQGIYVDIEGVSSVHMFHKRTSSDSMSRTPSVNVPQKSKQPIEDYDELPDLWVENEQDEEELPVVPVKRTASSKPSKYDRALKAWNAGNKSIRRLAEALNLNFNQARDMINDMHNNGIINKHDR
jgi:hypothetical protein